jgi:histone-lysine N-methyltransferase SETMAR
MVVFCVFGVSLKTDNKNRAFSAYYVFYFKRGKKATQTQGNICAMYGEDAVNERTCRKWFARFRAGNFYLDDAPRSGRQAEVDDDQIKTLIENNPRNTTRVIAEILKISQTAFVEQLQELGYESRLDVCDSLYKRNENDQFFK